MQQDENVGSLRPIEVGGSDALAAAAALVVKGATPVKNKGKNKRRDSRTSASSPAAAPPTMVRVKTEEGTAPQITDGQQQQQQQPDNSSGGTRSSRLVFIPKTCFPDVFFKKNINISQLFCRRSAAAGGIDVLPDDLHPVDFEDRRQSDHSERNIAKRRQRHPQVRIGIF